MVTIQNLDVTFDVEGEGDSAAFSRLFERHIEAWCRRQERETRRRQAVEEQRGLGDRPAGRGGVR
jgi:hypothetical protein